MSKIKCRGSIILFLLLALVCFPNTKAQAANVVKEAEANDNRNNANKIDQYNTMVGSISEGDVDWYKYEVDETGYCTIILSEYDYTDTESHYNITIYDKALNVLESASYQYSYTSKKYNYKKGTVLYIAVEGYNSKIDYASEYGSYALDIKFKKSSVWEQESNNSSKNATKLSKKTKGTIFDEKDVDWYKYVAKDTGYVYFDFCNEDGIVNTKGWTIRIYDSHLNQMQYGDAATDINTAKFFVKKKDILYISVEMNGTLILDKVYSIKPVFKKSEFVETEGNDSFDKADVIKNKQTYLGNLYSGEDIDYYKYTASKTGKYKLTFSLEDTIKYGYNIVIYDSSKNRIAEMSDVTYSDDINLSLKKGKTYYIKIEHKIVFGGFNSSLCLYKIKIANTK